MLIALVLFAAALALLLVAARVFTAAAERIGLLLGMSPFVVGVFIVAIGTSLPELVAALVAVRAGASEIVAGNVLGANVANLLMLLGAVAVVARGRVSLGEQYLMIDQNFLVGSAFMLGVTMQDGELAAVEGLLLLAAYAVYVVYLLREGRTAAADAAAARTVPDASRRLALDVLALVAGGIAIFFGGDFTVAALGRLALQLDISPAVASVTILSIGTTLPELAVSVAATRKGQAALAVGNILGSCVFNALAVCGAAALTGGVAVPAALATFALPFLLGTTLLFYLLTQDKLISRWEGMLFLVLFGLFVAKTSGVA
jgi:cation:H+ antiporter